jgi:hypothetical protein
LFYNSRYETTQGQTIKQNKMIKPDRKFIGQAFLGEGNNEETQKTK